MNREDKKECTGRDCGGKEIKGITCDVRNCVYHDTSNCCMAGHIAVGPSYAHSSSDTVCATFKPKDN